MNKFALLVAGEIARTANLNDFYQDAGKGSTKHKVPT